MASVAIRTPQRVGGDDVVRVLADHLGPMFHVSAHFNRVRIARPGLISSSVRLSHRDGGTAMTVRTCGVRPARLVRPSQLSPRVRAILKLHYVDAHPVAAPPVHDVAGPRVDPSPRRGVGVGAGRHAA
jgi:hypothetical protein